jgi:hypothetical protein
VRLFGYVGWGRSGGNGGQGGREALGGEGGGVELINLASGLCGFL